jgi:glycosyltransferase involved in cell wall biosynthesis
VKPVLFVTGHVPAYRVGALARLHEREQIELALFGGHLQHGGAAHATELPFPHRAVRPYELASLAASGRYRAVVCPTGGRLAPLATWAGARRGQIPLILWASLWAHPRSAAHALSYLPLRRLYRAADAVVTYGPHVSAYVSARGARNVYVAPQSVDNDFWRAPPGAPPSSPHWPAGAETSFLFVGRPVPGKGLPVLISAWRDARLSAPGAALILVGADADSRADTDSRDANSSLDANPEPEQEQEQEHNEGSDGRASILSLGSLAPEQVRDLYAACDVLVVPSVPTRTFREPWGLVVNEAMNQGLAVIATDAVGAAAGGLVRDGVNGLIVPAGDAHALSGAITELAADAQLRRRMGAAGADEVLAYNHDAWADGFSRALSSLGVSRGHW